MNGQTRKIELTLKKKYNNILEPKTMVPEMKPLFGGFIWQNRLNQHKGVTWRQMGQMWSNLKTAEKIENRRVCQTVWKSAWLLPQKESRERARQQQQCEHKAMPGQHGWVRAGEGTLKTTEGKQGGVSKVLIESSMCYPGAESGTLLWAQAHAGLHSKTCLNKEGNKERRQRNSFSELLSNSQWRLHQGKGVFSS